MEGWRRQWCVLNADQILLWDYPVAEIYKVPLLLLINLLLLGFVSLEHKQPIGTGRFLHFFCVLLVCLCVR